MRSPSFYVCSPPSGGRFWYRVPSEEQGKGPPERTKRVGAVSRTEDASGAEGGFHAPGTPENASRTSGGCPQSVESAVLWAFEDASRTRRGCFWHGTPLKMRRVPQEAFLRTARIFRTVKACFWYRVLTLRQVATAAEQAAMSQAR